jgi:hypothetical protein
MNTIATRAISIPTFAPAPFRSRPSRAATPSARATPAPLPNVGGAENAEPLVRSLALPAPPTTRLEKLLTATILLAAVVALTEAFALMLQFAPPWDGFTGWVARLLA